VNYEVVFSCRLRVSKRADSLIEWVRFKSARLYQGKYI